MVDTDAMQTIIDEFLKITSGRNLISSGEVQNLLLDLRSELDNIKFSDESLPEPVGVS